MKKASLVGILCLALLLAAGTAQAQGLRFGFRAFGGLSYVGGGDLQKSLTGTAAFWDDVYTGFMNGSGEYKAFHLGMNFGGEFILQFSPNMAVGLGAGFIQASGNSEFNYTPGSWSSFDMSYKPNVSAIPITLSFFYFLPVSSQINVVVNLGAGFYLATLKLEDEWWFIAPFLDEYDLKASGFGFHGGIGLEFALSPQFALVAELRGRFANIRGFEGDWTLRIPAISLTNTESGTLYYYREDGTDWYYFGDSEPSWGGVSDAREMGVDFSGFGFVIGIIVRL